MEIRVLAGALAWLLEEENVLGEGLGAKPRTPYPRPGMPYFYGRQNCEVNRPRSPPRARPRTRDPARCPGEAIRWRSATKYPVGTVATKGKRGSLVGAIPDALCVDARKVSQ